MYVLERKLEFVFGEGPFKSGETGDFLVMWLLGECLPSFWGRFIQRKALNLSSSLLVM